MIARNPDNVLAAESLFSLYTEYRNVGFTEEQAMSLILEAVHASIMAQAYFQNGKL